MARVGPRSPSRLLARRKESAECRNECRNVSPANRRFPRAEGHAAAENASSRNPEIPRIAGTFICGRPYINYESACFEGSVARG
jgi:hypothetical protein